MVKRCYTYIVWILADSKLAAAMNISNKKRQNPLKPVNLSNLLLELGYKSMTILCTFPGR